MVDIDVSILRRENRRRNQLRVIVRTLVRKVVIGTASVIALGIAGDIASSALDYAADAGDTATAATMPAPVRTSSSALTGDALRRDDIRWAQVELRNRGLYRGSLDGIFGPETRRALSQFQTINGLGRTASLDAQTWEALTGNPSIGEGSSTPAHSDSTTNSSAASDLGR
jgi:peptidoglycan hydrolase-like protein with peptidoglycan-binding domain